MDLASFVRHVKFQYRSTKDFVPSIFHRFFLGDRGFWGDRGGRRVYSLPRLSRLANTCYCCSPRASCSCGYLHMHASAHTSIDYPYNTQDNTPPMVNFRTDFVRETRGAHTTKIVAMDRSRRDISICRRIARRLHPSRFRGNQVGNSSEGVCYLACYAVVHAHSLQTCEFHIPGTGTVCFIDHTQQIADRRSQQSSS